MTAEQFCAEYGYETKGGRVSFRRKIIENFIDIYTHLHHSDFTPEMMERLKISVMIDLYTKGCSFHYLNMPEGSPDKIELPEFIFQ